MIYACPRGAKSSVAPACQKELFKLQRDASEDFRADAELFEACEGDADSFCNGVPSGGGRVQACLVRPRQEKRRDGTLDSSI